jgi:hypothetical protein
MYPKYKLSIRLLNENKLDVKRNDVRASTRTVAADSTSALGSDWTNLKWQKETLRPRIANNSHSCFFDVTPTLTLEISFDNKHEYVHVLHALHTMPIHTRRPDLGGVLDGIQAAE